jgi:Bacteriophage T4-like portal protein (Gp20)
MATKKNKAWKYLPYTGVMGVQKKGGDDDAREKADINNKYYLFDDPSITKDAKVQRLSIVNKYDDQLSPYSVQNGMVRNDFYAQYVNKLYDQTKPHRLQEYRSMTLSPEVNAALTEIANEMIVESEEGLYFDIKVKEVSEEVEGIIKKEFTTFTEHLKIDERGRKYIWDYLVDGELFFENIVSIERPELGVIGFRKIAPERIDPIYTDIDNDIVDFFLLKKKLSDTGASDARAYSNYPNQTNDHTVQNIFLNAAQVLYARSGDWDEKRQALLGPLEGAKKAFKQLTLTEDATVIYMLVRAPERLVFNIHTGNLQGPQAEEYLQRSMSQFWTKKRMNADGGIENSYDPQSMIENYVFAKPDGKEGSTVSTVGGGSQSPDNLEILNFFVQKLYQSLHVPLQRLNVTDKFTDGTEVTREELKFAKHIIELQKSFAQGVKRAFITHLKLKGRKLKDLCRILEIPYKDLMGNAFDISKYMELEESVKTAMPNKLRELISRKTVLIREMEEYKRANHEELLLEYNQTSFGEEGEEEMISNVLKAYGQEISDINSDIYKIEETQSWWEQYELCEEFIKVKMLEPTQFFTLRKQQELQIKIDNYSKFAQDDMFSSTMAMKKYLGMTDKQIAANRQMLRSDAAFIWEITNIQESGPNFREQEADMAGGLGGGGMGDMAGGADMGGGGLLDGLDDGGSDMGDMGGDADMGGDEDTDLPEFGSPST